MTTTRGLRSYGPEHIYIEGLAKGPYAGWQWDGENLSHPLGISLHMAPAAAERITAAIAAYIPPTQDIRTAAEMATLSEAERAKYELRSEGWGEDEHDNEHVWRWVRTTDPVAGACEFDTAEVVATNIRRA